MSMQMDTRIGYIPSAMKHAHTLTLPALIAVATLSMVAIGAAQAQTPAPAQGRGAPAPPPPPQAGHGMGKLVLGGDIALFDRPANPDNCILTNRFKRGQRVGFRMTATDGGTGEVENTATLVAKVNYGGRTIEVPMRFRGAAGPTAPAPRGYLAPPHNLWTGFWVVPDDAPTGMLSYTVTATDKFGRSATFTPYSYETSQLTIVP
jgi:hypothetical protein